jgi:toxin ParE1/3/4
MKALHFTRKARRQLAEIAAYTAITWGVEQARLYRAELDKTLQALCWEPLMGFDIGDVRKGYRSFPSGRHVIFYRLSGNRLEITAVLHERMDPKRHL